jgi:hypothetical protein
VIDTSPASAPFRRHGEIRLAEQRVRRQRGEHAAGGREVGVHEHLATLLADSTSETLSSEPPLKPNQPSHRMKVPSVASGRFAPGMALT